MPNYIFWDIASISEWDIFEDRRALRSAGIHLKVVQGIDWNPNIWSPSIVLNGGYEDDQDLGDEIIYTGEGGNDPSTNKQIDNQSWEATGNKALLVSELHWLPVRVTRGYKNKSQYSPASGYKYGGLYFITDHFEQKGRNGFTICRFRLQKMSDLDLTGPGTPNVLTAWSEESKRVQTTILRIVRDTRLSREIKELYDFTCQICWIKISVRNIKYAEAAHIKPLWKPHNWKDKSDNLLCLCPNHHVMFDKGMFAISDNLMLIGIEGTLNMDKWHILDTENLRYHNEHIFINH